MITIDTIEPFVCNCRKYLNAKGKFSTLHWSLGNNKLAKLHIVSFNLPAYKSANGTTVCHNAGLCARLCYARQGYYVLPSAQAPREHNLQFLLSHSTQDFVATAVADILLLPKAKRHVRIHDSGDFMSEAYFLAWCDIARRSPHMYFYTYTKMISMVNSLRNNMPDNMHVIQSAGGKEDALIDKRFPHAIIFPSHAAITRAGYYDGTKTEEYALDGTVKIGLAYHGSPVHAKMTKSESNALARRNSKVLHDTPLVAL